jgi:hypothetical protein
MKISLFLRLAQLPGTSSSLQSGRVALSASQAPSSMTDIIELNATEQKVTSPHLLASKASSNALIALTAVDEIVALRKSQEAVAKAARETSNPTLQQSLQSQLSSIESEITRIISEATDENGINVLSGSTYTIDDNLVVSLADLQGIGQLSGVDISSTAGAISAEQTLESLTQIAISGRESAAASFERAQDILQVATTRYINSHSQVSDGAMEQLSQEIASQISSLHSPIDVHRLESELIEFIFAQGE